MNAPLFLTRQNADNHIFVPAKMTDRLNDYDIDSIRHIYKFYQKNINVVLNIENNMNEPKQINAFLTAVKIVPAIVLCSDSDISKWETEFATNQLFNLFILRDSNDVVPDNENVIVLAPHSILRRALHLREITWQLLVIQNIDAVIDLASINKLKSKFRIAFTKHNFVLNPNRQLCNKILRWIADDNKLLTYNEFYIPDKWLRLSWNQY